MDVQMQLLDVETQVPSSWKSSPRKCAFVVGVVSAALLAGVFVAGFFTGKSLSTFTSMMTGLQVHNESSKSSSGQPKRQGNWQDAVCSLHRPSCPWSESEGKAVVLISLDGFRAEYMTRNLTPSILTLAECGVTTPYMRASYPTKTFPNHYTIVTGLFPESHGIIDNSAYDPVLNTTFKIGSKEMYRTDWWIGEPIWETVEKQGKLSATYFWPGSDVEIHGMRPTFSERYNRSVAFEVRVDQILTWLASPFGQRPQLLTVYLEDPDRTGHKYGPVSSQITDVLPYVDSIVGRLMTGLQNNDILGCVNVIIVSDHGMAPINCEDEIFLEELSSSHALHSYRGREGESPRIQPEPPLSPEELRETINELNCQKKSARFYDKYKLPKRYHYANSRRIERIVIDLQEGWRVYRSNNSKHRCEGGAHGYDNLLENMRAIFVANGPSLKQHLEVQPFLNVEVYNLMCDLVGVVPSPNNGTNGCLRDALLASPHHQSVAERDTVAPHAPFCQYVSDNDPPVGCEVFNSSTPRHDNEVENNAPWGVPAKTQYTDLCVIANEQYVLGYDVIRQMPIWASFSPKHNVSTNGDESWFHDERAKAADCARFQTEELRNASVEQTPLFPTTFASDSQARFVTNAVPMYAKFKKETLGVVENKMRSWLLQWGSLNVVTGPIWDYDGDSLPDRWNGLEVPSHYFLVITRCLLVEDRVEDCDESQLDNLSFILPHADDVEHCMDPEEHLLKHTASVRDVELATGLRFYVDMHNKHSLLLRLKLPERLWTIVE